MSKELVIASNRHETKVAVLEDDQLVEILFQRANEYSLAGSIHKGRVTRVLPGMQSAFVDIGLERDAFLYVTDFFEENGEDIDPVEPKPTRQGRGGGVIQPPPPIAVTAPPVPVEEELAAEPAPLAVEAPPLAERRETERRDDDRGDRRGGRRSRRRRGRGRGFPDSKYASDLAPEEQQNEQNEPEEEPAAVDETVPMLLPGESLAKYRRSAPAAAEPAAKPLETQLPPMLAEEQAAAEQLGDDAPAVGEAARGEEIPAEVEPPAPNQENAADFGEEVEASREAVEEPEAAMEEPEAPEFDTEPAESEEAQGSGEEEETSADDSPDEEEPALAVETEEAPPEQLTASVREQTGRFPHRVNRRMRRKMRAQQNAEQRTDSPAAAPVEEVRAPRQERPEKDRPPQPSITDLLREGQEIIVQIAKEPLGQKGARITSHIALPGRYVVYMPTLEHLGVSRKISTDEERQRLKRILQTHRTGITGGFIVRTAGEGRTEQEIASDMAFLYNLWLDMRQKAEKKPAPVLLHHDLDIVQRILRDQLNEDFKAIWCDNEDTYESVLRFMQRFQPALVPRVKLYTRPQPIFDSFSVTSELEKALRPKVWLKSGGYIVINQTEALVAVDVNTGKYVGKSNRLEDTIVKTNTEAVKEIVRQIRLRDLGGIIVVDFIDMDERKNRQKVMQALEEAMRADRAPYKLLQFNDFGLVAITRKRVKQSLERTLCSPCPTCEGSGYVKSVQTVVGEMLQEAAKLRKVLEDENVVLRCHPEVAKFLKSVENKYLEELEETLGRPVLVKGDVNIHPEKFDLA